MTKESIVQQNDVLYENLDATKEQLEILSKQYGELEAKSKADVKVLVKEVKSLRNSQTKLKKELSESIKEHSETEVGYKSAHIIFCRRFFLDSSYIFLGKIALSIFLSYSN